MTTDPKLLEAIQFIKDAGDRDEQEIVQELQATRPDLLISLAASCGWGDYLELMFRASLDKVLGRADIKENIKAKVRADADRFWALLERLQETPPALLPCEAIIEFAGIALLTGLQVGLSPDEIDALRRRDRSDFSRGGGKESGKSRRELRPWPAHAQKLAKAAYAANNDASDGAIASYIENSWASPTAKCPGYRTLETFVSDLRKSADLPQRARSFPKRTGSA